MKENRFSQPKSPLRLLNTLGEQARIRFQYGPEFIGDLETIEVGLTPRNAIYTEGSQVLYHYPNQTVLDGKPIFLVYSLINRPYIFDLRPGRSLIEFLCKQGYDVYLLDWGDPLPEMGYAGLDDLVLGTLRRCVRKIQRRHSVSSIPVLGYCMGATFAALYAAFRPQDIKRLILLTPMLGNDSDGLLQKISSHQDLSPDLLTSQLINGRELKMFFNAIKPAGMLKKERDFWRNYDSDTFLEHFLPVEKWGNDTPNIPGKAFQEFLHLVIKQDALRSNQVQLGSESIDMSEVQCPVLAVAAKHDWIIPSSTLQTCQEVFSQADYTPYLLKGGHIGLVVGRSAGLLWHDLDRFLSGETVTSPLEVSL